MTEGPDDPRPAKTAAFLDPPEQATHLPGLEIVPLSLPIVSAAVRLDTLRDPADQLIVATALDRGASLVTSDAGVADSDLVAVVA